MIIKFPPGAVWLKPNSPQPSPDLPLRPLSPSDMPLTEAQENWLFLYNPDALAEHEELFKDLQARFQRNPYLRSTPPLPDPFDPRPLPEGTRKTKANKKTKKKLLKRPA